MNGTEGVNQVPGRKVGLRMIVGPTEVTGTPTQTGNRKVVIGYLQGKLWDRL